jgi:pilus assembly protein Flp/PilA
LPPSGDRFFCPLPVRSARNCSHVLALAAVHDTHRMTRGTPVAFRPAVTRRLPRASIGNAAGAAIRTARGRCNPLGEDLMQLVNFVKSFVRNEEGQDLLEYALLVALIALVAVAAVAAAGSAVNTIFTSIANALSAAA